MDVWMGVLGFVLFLGFGTAVLVCVAAIKRQPDIIIKSILNGEDATYEVDSSIKEAVCYNEIVAINLGTEIHFINLNGWLEKKYKSNQEAKEIVLGTSVVGIIYRDRIKILAF